jgi:hypothetical protein
VVLLMEVAAAVVHPTEVGAVVGRLMVAAEEVWVGMPRLLSRVCTDSRAGVG